MCQGSWSESFQRFFFFLPFLSQMSMEMTDTFFLVKVQVSLGASTQILRGKHFTLSVALNIVSLTDEYTLRVYWFTEGWPSVRCSEAPLTWSLCSSVL